MMATLPVNPHNGKAVLLTPRAYLRSLPTPNAEDFWEGFGPSDNDALRANVNHDISSRVRKADIVRYAREHPDKLLENSREKEKVGSAAYDFSQDDDGLVGRWMPTKAFCQRNPIGGDIRTAAELREFLESLPAAFADSSKRKTGGGGMWSGARHARNRRRSPCSRAS